jgi:hypothetical protein
MPNEFSLAPVNVPLTLVSVVEDDGRSAVGEVIIALLAERGADGTVIVLPVVVSAASGAGPLRVARDQNVRSAVVPAPTWQGLPAADVAAIGKELLLYDAPQRMASRGLVK